jgi:glycosyltransferase involved in cell wall biosynthesis
MPVHNGMPYVAESVASILAQRFTDFEFVIGDDGSSDGTSQLLAGLAAQDSRIRLLRRESKSGLAAAANWVVSEARAPLVAISHADDLAHPDRLGKQIEAFAREPAASLIGTLSTGMDAGGRVVHPPNMWPLTHPTVFAPFAHSSVMFRRDNFHRAGGYRQGVELWEDLDLYWRMLETGPIFVIPEILSNYRHSRVSVRDRAGDEQFERSVALMYHASRAYLEGRSYDDLRTGKADLPAKLPPRVFVSRTWIRIWNGERPSTVRRLLRRGDLRLDRASLQTLVLLGAATVSPKGLRRLLALITGGRNRLAARRLAGRSLVEWRPRDAAPR